MSIPPGVVPPARPPAAPAGRSFLRIGEAARHTALTPRAIRHYESLGLLRPAVRVEGGNRLFDQHDLERLAEIRRLREVLGFTLAEIGEMLETEDQRRSIRSDLSTAPDPAAQATLLAQARTLALRRVALIDIKIGQLTALRQEEVERLSRLEERLERLAGLYE